jgi:hypothetical protein
MILGVQRLLALMVAGAVATTSVAAEESCPTMRAQGLKRCCCPPGPQGQARLTCCTATPANRSTAAARDRQEKSQLAAAAVAVPWSFVSRGQSLLVPVPTRALVPSASGPPLPTLRI